MKSRNFSLLSQALFIALFLSACGTETAAPVPASNAPTNGNVAPVNAGGTAAKSDSQVAQPAQQQTKKAVELPPKAKALIAKAGDASIAAVFRFNALLELSAYKHPSVQEILLKLTKYGPGAPEGISVTPEFTQPYADFSSSDPYEYAARFRPPFVRRDLVFTGKGLSFVNRWTALWFQQIAMELLAEQGQEGMESVLDYALTIQPDSEAEESLQTEALLLVAKSPHYFTQILDVLNGTLVPEGGLSKRFATIAAIGLGRNGTLSEAEVAQVLLHFTAESDLGKRMNYLPVLTQQIHTRRMRTLLDEYVAAAPMPIAEEIAVLMVPPNMDSRIRADSGFEYIAFRERHLERLAQFGSAKSLRSLKRIVDYNEALAVEALHQMRTINSADALALLLSYARHKAPKTSKTALDLLISIDTPEADAFLWNLYTAHNSEFQLRLHTLLVYERPEKSRQAALRIVLKMENIQLVTLRKVVDYILGEDVISILVSVISDKARSRDIRGHARNRLFSIGTPEAKAAWKANPIED